MPETVHPAKNSEERIFQKITFIGEHILQVEKLLQEILRRLGADARTPPVGPGHSWYGRRRQRLDLQAGDFGNSGAGGNAGLTDQQVRVFQTRFRTVSPSVRMRFS